MTAAILHILWSKQYMAEIALPRFGCPEFASSSACQCVALQACVQICMKSGGKVSEAGLFMGDRCTPLREAFDFTGLLLKPATPDTPETGSTIAW